MTKLGAVGTWIYACMQEGAYLRHGSRGVYSLPAIWHLVYPPDTHLFNPSDSEAQILINSGLVEFEPLLSGIEYSTYVAEAVKRDMIYA